MIDVKKIADGLSEGPEEFGKGEIGEDELAAEDVLAAFAENDPKALASALKGFFKIVDAEPHVGRR